MSNRAQRFPANFPVVLRQGPNIFCATICNISTGGACLIGVTDMRKGDTMVLDYIMGQTRATVTWTAGKMAGIRFDDLLSDTGVQCIHASKKLAG